MSNKKKFTGKNIATGIVAVVAAAALSLFGINGKTTVEIEYEVVKGDKATELVIYPPEDASVDIIELYCNKNLVTKTVLPSGKLKSIPLVFSDLNNLELRLYKKGEVVGIGNFKDGKLYVAFKDEVIEYEK